MHSEGADVTVSDILDSYLDEELMGALDLIVQIWMMNKITKEQEAGLLKFMVGGQWVVHPGGIINYRVNITDQKDSVTKALKDFDLHTEQYFLHIDPNIKSNGNYHFYG